MCKKAQAVREDSLVSFIKEKGSTFLLRKVKPRQLAFMLYDFEARYSL